MSINVRGGSGRRDKHGHFRAGFFPDFRGAVPAMSMNAMNDHF
jgi:hypothetical protein